ncbi:undecaprenyldiphospho-muramoylpentapeptide beta-N-acetylglucosaminyltransferase [Leeia sp. TBRC 13508]|uniref:UDP-N-acetylglucosamine--N-acetylmuramyl-(pentapeptide) pyrophosphoryl-undecaprenol N-acetylglucosamine transferase n=1 Tax=Leeia speluncae TaxID=2884804 RepID=A0ABS8D5K8_9NEIS|nr:undecaprenyldiphospho-muramoylpentapeptide beta-N-acetylglucosaminyltransferase [Leeia speluncae]MCB6183496.1 undecaprenyldiphospho-muramoylpentapeptide beta-N-acetylglucosaminyltransferase [Leeia speluncae]
MSNKTALIMAAGTGGHIFPALAVADALSSKGWKIVWLGTIGGMENRLVANKGYPIVQLEMKGVRGNGIVRKLMAPAMLAKSVLQARKAIQVHRPSLVVGFGGYVCGPGAVAAKLSGIPLVIHEQNAIAGMTNRLAAKMAKLILQAFPKAFEAASNVRTVGNPVRDAICQIQSPALRYENRQGALNLLVVGGSLGAKALNEVVPAAIALLPTEMRPRITHQSGEKQIAELRANYEAAGVGAEAVPFIEDMASALAAADVVICRAGALTVSELAVAGVPGIYVPLPHAVDDHQTANAKSLTENDAGWLLPQSSLNANSLAALLQGLTREELKRRAMNARQLGLPHATDMVVVACEEVAK